MIAPTVPGMAGIILMFFITASSLSSSSVFYRFVTGGPANSAGCLGAHPRTPRTILSLSAGTSTAAVHEMFTSLCFKIAPDRKEHASRGGGKRALHIPYHATVQALASRGGEVALNPAFCSTGPVQTNEGCLHPFAAATHIPTVALPTGLRGYYILFPAGCQPLVKRLGRHCTTTFSAPSRSVRSATRAGWIWQ